MLEPESSCNFELNNDCGFAKYQTQASLMHHSVKLTQTISIMEQSWIKTLSMTNCSQQVHQSQHNRGRKVQTNLCRFTGGNTHQIRGIKQIITIRGGRVFEFLHRSPFSVVAASFSLAQQRAKRSHPFTDEASKYTHAASESKPVGKRVPALAAVRHAKSSPLFSAQEKT